MYIVVYQRKLSFPLDSSDKVIILSVSHFIVYITFLRYKGVGNSCRTDYKAGFVVENREFH